MKLVKRFAVGAAVLIFASISASTAAEAQTRADTPTVMRLGANLRAEMNQGDRVDTPTARPPVPPAPPVTVEWEGEPLVTDDSNEERNAPSVVEVSGDGKVVIHLPHILRGLREDPRPKPDATRPLLEPKHSSGSKGSDSHDKDAGEAPRRPRDGKALRGNP
jgi:hypothetical protein